MEEEEDKILLQNLGVPSANPEDIERDILAKAEKEVLDSSEVGGSTEEEPPVKSESYDPSSTCQEELLTKIRAVKFEIDAVASTIEQASHDISEDGDDTVKKENPSDLLQHALATDRLRSLEKTKANLEQKLSGFPKNSKKTTSEGIDHARLIQNLVKDDFRPKRMSKEVQKPNKNKEKRLKTVKLVYDDDFDAVLNAASAGFVETERDELVRKGILTPFHKLKGFERSLQQPGTSNLADRHKADDENADTVSARVARAAESFSKAAKNRPTTKILDSENLPKLGGPTIPFQRLKTPVKYCQSDKEEEDGKGSRKKKIRPLPDKKWRKLISCEERHWEEEEEEGEECMPDDERDCLVTAPDEEENPDVVEDIDDRTPHVTLEGGLKIPENIFDKLFDYQKVGVQWLWELHCQRAGGIIGDEMGLGKTVQILSFLGALHFSDMYKPSIVICPVTLLRQWKREARRWYPKFRVKILHDSARDTSSRHNQATSDASDSESEASPDSDYEGKIISKKAKIWDSLINKVLRSKCGLLITTYEQLRILGDQLLDIEWGYAILDEGHRIRNPNAEVTLVCKQLQTVHRIIMTGSPIQNKLTELWSLFDFVFPGKLGVLPVFEVEFAVPITVGGYANASPLQVSTAYRCAVVLRDLIMPYLLRRMKADVNAQLPKKTEHVLFCSLTAEQRSIYRAFLASSDVEQIFDGSRNSLYGIDVMRKICNHPDLLEREHSQHHVDYGNPERSGKMKVVAQVLKVWKEQGHHVLLFAQTQQMLDIIESFLVSEGHSYRRMDGLTPVKQRMALIDEFNNSEDVFVFILTTKVGGLGTNLTGADRVIIFDPDWNPSTDMQARERAWRIGQKRDVTVYRLITRGTIEEKVYHRQIYKHFLTNKILKNPKQRRFFKARDMKDLFTLNDDEENLSTETSNIFGQVSEDVNILGTQNDKQETLRHPEAGKPRASHALGGNGDCTDLSRKGKEKSVPGDDVVDEETNILKSLFDAQGIHSAMNHDAIMNAHDDEKVRLEEQASQVAQRAVEALRQSRMLRSRDNVSVPTWTGKSGTAGAPSAVRKKFGSTLNTQLLKQGNESSSNGIAAGAAAGKALSSAQLLSRIQGNQESAIGAGFEHHPGSASSSGNGVRTTSNGTSRSSPNTSRIQPEVLARRIHTFIQQRGGNADSGSIVEHFKERISPDDLPLFKNLLKQIAILEKGRNGSRWILKPEHQ